MDELKEILHFIRTGQFMATENAIRKIINKTAYVVPKCPKCGSGEVHEDVVVTDSDELWCEWFCEDCVHRAKGDTPAEAAKAFGDSSGQSK